ncbi:hypothetical protein [Methanobrevibacter arboriphilus]|uniref:hypothetical protein n=1 Tax=Methanobrevibacter arboriphilus TaxID=39441 RepID=UPI000AEBB757|nr:hypothetical protein [Methanobrevibacter arboriphilus]
MQDINNKANEILKQKQQTKKSLKTRSKKTIGKKGRKQDKNQYEPFNRLFQEKYPKNIPNKKYNEKNIKYLKKW